MALVDVDTWVSELESCERLSYTIMSQINQRDQFQKLPNEYSKISASIRIRLRQFETELSQLKIKLDVSSTSGNITVEEIERRQRQIETLQSRLLHLQNKFRQAQSTDRKVLLEQAGSSVWEDDVPILSDTNEDNSAQDLRQQQISIMEEQNRGLEALSKSISRQKDLATRLGQEVTDQNDILDDLANNMEEIDTRVNNETANISLINRQDSTWRYWLVIVILFVLIIIVSFI